MLVRPELALVGGLALVMMVLAASSWRRRLLIVAAGGALPVAYQIFRMGYYGLLVPADRHRQGRLGRRNGRRGCTYLGNFNASLSAVDPGGGAGDPGRSCCRSRVADGGGSARMSAANAAPDAHCPKPHRAVVFIVLSGAIQAVYWVRQGGDFMHGRVLLHRIVPDAGTGGGGADRDPATPRNSADAPAYLLAGATSLLWVSVAGWSLWAANSPGMGADATRVTYTGIVDERRFYAQATGHAHPLTAADYLDYPRMRAVLVALRNTPDGALLLPSGNYDVWDVVPAIPPPPDKPRPPAKPARTQSSSPIWACSG